MITRRILCVGALGVAVQLSACAGGGWQPTGPDGSAESAPHAVAVEAVAHFEERDPTISELLAQAHAFAVFPAVGKGGAWVGGAYGHGLVYRRGQLIGRATLTQVTAGAGIGAQTYSEIIFFRDGTALAEFMRGNYVLGAHASAITVAAGAAANASYDRGVAIFTAPRRGLMFRATVAGQRFSFESAEG